MRENIVQLFVTLIVTTLLLCVCYGQEPKNDGAEKPTLITDQEIEFYLHLQDAEDESSNKRFDEIKRKMLELGETLFPLYEEILRGTDNMAKSRILTLLQEVQEDKTSLLPATRNLLNGEKYVAIDAIRALSKFGTDDDVATFIKLLEHKEEFIRCHAARALFEKGKEDTAKEIMNVLEKRSQELKNEQIKKDSSFVEGYKAILDIKKRITKEKSEKEADKKKKEELNNQLKQIESEYQNTFIKYGSEHWISSLLISENEFERIVSARALAEIGNEKTASDIEKCLETRKENKTPEEIKKDPSFEEGYKAVKVIREREKKKKDSSDKSGSDNNEKPKDK